MTIDQFIAGLLGPTSTVFLLGVIVIGAVWEWWVPGRRYRRMERERDEAIRLGWRLAGLSEHVVKSHRPKRDGEDGEG